MTTTPIPQQPEHVDVVIIGGGPAGLQAALTLGRMHRSVLLVDSGEYRNGPAAHLHNLITHDGRPPQEFRELARRDLSAYATVTLREGRVEQVEQDDAGWSVRVGDSTDPVRARRVLLATGVRDTLPPTPGIAELFGTVVAHCPYCHGHEFAGRRVAILGASPAALHLSALLEPIASELVVLSDGAAVDPEVTEGLAAAGVPVRPGRVSKVEPAEVGATVVLEDGDPIGVGGLFVTTTFAQSAPFAEQLGLDLLPSGCIAVDEFGRTSRPGISAAGDLAHVPALPMPLASVLVAAAAGQSAAAMMNMELAG